MDESLCIFTSSDERTGRDRGTAPKGDTAERERGRRNNAVDTERRKLTIEADFDIITEGGAPSVDARFFGLPKEESVLRQDGAATGLCPLGRGITAGKDGLEGLAKGSRSSSPGKGSGPSMMVS